jgi:hypothetical protein
MRSPVGSPYLPKQNCCEITEHTQDPEALVMHSDRQLSEPCATRYMDLPRTMGAPAENPSDTMLTTAHFKAAFFNAAFFYA